MNKFGKRVFYPKTKEIKYLHFFKRYEILENADSVMARALEWADSKNLSVLKIEFNDYHEFFEANNDCQLYYLGLWCCDSHMYNGIVTLWYKKPPEQIELINLLEER